MDFVDQVLLQVVWPTDLEDLVRHDRTVGELRTALDDVALADQDFKLEGDYI